MVTLGPRAAGVGISAVAMSSYWDEVSHWFQQVTGLDVTGSNGELSRSSIVRTINKQMDSSMNQIKDYARQEARAARGGWHVNNGSSWLAINPVLLLKLLCAGGVILGILKLLGFGWQDISLVTRRTISTKLQMLEDTIKTIQDNVEQQFKELIGNITYYRDELGDLQEEMTTAISEMDTEVANVHENINEVSQSTTQMETKISGTNQGIQMLCQVVADNFPNTPAQQGLRSYARDSITATHEMERQRPSLTGRLFGRLMGTATSATTDDLERAQPALPFGQRASAMFRSGST